MSLHWYDGMLVDLVVDSSATGRSYALMDVRARAGTRIAHHLHRREDETLQVLYGELDVWLDGERRAVGAGGHVFLPRGIPHGFTVTSGEARFLWLCAPGGIDGVVRAMGEPAGGAVLPPAGSIPLDPLALDDAAAILSAAEVTLLPADR